MRPRLWLLEGADAPPTVPGVVQVRSIYRAEASDPICETVQE